LQSKRRNLKQKSQGKGVARAVDDTDRAILAELRKNPQASNKSLAQKLGVSEMTIANRIDRLISDRLMKITTQRDVRTLGLNVLGFIEIYVNDEDVKTVGRRIGDVPNVIAATIQADHPQIIVMLAARDTVQLSHLLEAEIAPIAGVNRAVTSMCLEVLRHRPGIAVL